MSDLQEITLQQRLAQREAEKKAKEQQRVQAKEREARQKERQQDQEKEREQRQKQQQQAQTKEKETKEKEKEKGREKEREQDKQKRAPARAARGAAPARGRAPVQRQPQQAAPGAQKAPPKPPPVPPPPKKPDADKKPMDPVKRAEQLTKKLRSRYQLPSDVPKPTGTPKRDKAMEGLIQEGRQLLEAYKGAGVMIAFFLTPSLQKKVAVPGGEPPDELHLTVIYLGSANDVGEEKLLEVSKVCKRYAKRTPPMRAMLSGSGRFSAGKTSGGKDVLYVSVDAPDLPEFRQKLVQALTRAGVTVPKDHGYTPHVTQAYVDAGAYSSLGRFEPTRTTFGKLTLSVGTWRRSYPLEGTRDK